MYLTHIIQGEKSGGGGGLDILKHQFLIGHYSVQILSLCQKLYIQVDKLF